MAILPNIARLFSGLSACSYVWRVLLLSLLACADLQASAGHEHPELATDTRLTLTEVLSASLRIHPRQAMLGAQAATAQALTRYGSRWLPDSPQLNAYHMSDRGFDDIGAIENQVAFSLPVWMPGEKRAQAALGEAAMESGASREAGFRWQLSGEVRQRLWHLQLATRQWQLAEEQEARLQQVLEQVQRLEDAGELSRADLLSTLQELAVWKAETIALEAEYQDAARAYRTFTGLSIVPAELEEPLSAATEAGPQHPALRQASDRLAEASAAAEAVARTVSTRPMAELFWRGYRGDRLSTEVDSIGIGFTVPLGRSPRKGPETARAQEAVAQAESDYLQTVRDVELGLHEARHQLETIRQQLANSQAMIDTATEKYELDRLSFELGELSTNQWLRHLAAYKNIERSHQLLQVQHGAAIAAYNQAVGETL